MSTKPLTKEEEHDIYHTRFMKTPQEKLDLKAAKAAWKKSLKNEQAKG